MEPQKVFAVGNVAVRALLHLVFRGKPECRRGRRKGWRVTKVEVRSGIRMRTSSRIGNSDQLLLQATLGCASLCEYLMSVSSRLVGPTNNDNSSSSSSNSNSGAPHAHLTVATYSSTASSLGLETFIYPAGKPHQGFLTPRSFGKGRCALLGLNAEGR
jgi:hypothetical protein